MTVENALYFKALMYAAGGVAFLLFGLDMLSHALKAMAGDRLRYVLTKLTDTRLKAVASGAGVTMLAQSSAATIAMLLGFVATGFMALPRALGVILGADIGTTFTVQLITFRVNKYALIIIALGFFISLIARNPKIKEFGKALLSVGFLFYGIHLISVSADTLQEIPAVLGFLSHLSSPLLGVLAGIFMAASMQSSAAAMGVIVTLSASGIIPLEAAIPLTLGANVGTCITAIIACSDKPRTAWRVAAAHVFFKSSAVIIALPFAHLLPQAITWLIPNIPEPHQIAIFHTAFNVIIASIFLPFTPQIAKILMHYIGEKVEMHENIKPKFLDKGLISTPSLAFDAAQKEIVRMTEKVEHMMSFARPFILTGSKIDLARIANKENDIDALYKAIVAYLGEINKEPLTSEQSTLLLSFMTCTNHLETVSDLIGVNLTNLGDKRLNRNIVVSEQTQEVLLNIYDLVTKALTLSAAAIKEDDPIKAEECLALKADINEISKEAHKHQAARLIAEEDNRIQTYDLEIDILDTLQRIYFHTRKPAYEVIYRHQRAQELQRKTLKQDEQPKADYNETH